MLIQGVQQSNSHPQIEINVSDKGCGEVGGSGASTHGFYTDVVEPEVLCSQYASLILDEQRGLAEAKVYLQRGVGYAMRLTA